MLERLNTRNGPDQEQTQLIIRRRKGRRREQTQPLIVLLLISSLQVVVTAHGADGPSAISFKYAAPPLASNSPRGDTSSSISEQEQQRQLAQLAIQELIQLQQREQLEGDEGQRGAEEKKKQRKAENKKTHIWPYSQYEQKMAKIFGENQRRRQKGSSGQSQEQEGLMQSPDRPVVIHLPAYRNVTPTSTTPTRGNQGKMLFSTSYGDHVHSRGSNSARPNPIRPQSSRWHHHHQYSTATGGTTEIGTNRNRIAHPHIGSSGASSAEKLLMITRPGGMFMPARSSSNSQQQHLVPIQPINSNSNNNAPRGPDQSQNPLISQLFIKRIASAIGGGGTPISDNELDERRFAPPPPNSVVVPGAGTSAAYSGGLYQPAGPATVPLAGSPFDLLAPSGSVPNPALLSQLPNPLQFFAQGNTLEQITALARNLIQMSNGNQDLLSSLTKAIGSSSSSSSTGSADPASKLTSTAVQAIAKNVVKVGSAPGGDTVRTLFSSSSSNTTAPEGTELVDEKELTLNATSAGDLLNGLPPEQRSLLEAAMKNGELDATQTAKAFSGPELNMSKKAEMAEGPEGKPRIVNAESRLMEWIQQNRPRQAERDPGVGIMGTATVGADKMPYYGRYCGTFVEQPNMTRPHNIAGAVWAVDERRLLLSKFHFQPLDHSENITFWAGPANHTGAQQDQLPSENGFFLLPTKLDARTFLLKPVQRMPAHVRNAIAPVNAQQRDQQKSDNKNGTTIGKPAEGEEEEAGIGTPEGTNSNLVGMRRARRRRNLYSELYGQMGEEQEGARGGTTSPEGTWRTTTASSTTTTATVPIHFGGTAQKFHMSVGGQPREWPPGEMMAIDPPEAFPYPYHQAPAPAMANQRWTPLEWHGGTQPVLLTLPPSRQIKTLNWLGVWDHTQKQALALVLIPSAVSAFHPPSMVQLRPLPPPNSALGSGIQLQSGPIRVLDTKTIELTEFSLTTKGVPVWFMVGKEIMPTQHGNIVPVFNKDSGSVDCDSLRDFHNETVTLRLPDPLDIKDVFWFALYSLPRAQSLSHIYIPYNDMQLPPDLMAVPTPQCTWTPPAG